MNIVTHWLGIETLKERFTIEADTRRYSDKEVALILRKAAELQERGAHSSAGEGLPLQTVAEIANEVGMDPELVKRAATRLEDDIRNRAALISWRVAYRSGSPIKFELSSTNRYRGLRDTDRVRYLDSDAG